MANVFVGLALKEKLRNELQKEADELGLSLSAYIRMILMQRKK